MRVWNDPPLEFKWISSVLPFCMWLTSVTEENKMRESVHALSTTDSILFIADFLLSSQRARWRREKMFNLMLNLLCNAKYWKYIMRVGGNVHLLYYTFCTSLVLFFLVWLILHYILKTVIILLSPPCFKQWWAVRASKPFPDDSNIKHLLHQIITITDLRFNILLI